jgi:cysteine-rich repeat protein
VDPWEACDWGALNSDAPDAGCRTDCTPRRCGDGIIDADEVCDGSALGGLDCPALGMTGGPVSCASDCAVDVSRCDRCGDGVAGPSEVCDGSDLHGATCATVGFVSGVIRCTAACGLDPSGCGRCGDGSLDPGEACDDGDLASRDGCSSGCTAESLGWTRIPAAIPGGFQPSAMVGFPPLGGIVLVWGRNRELIPYASWVYDGERFERLPDEQVLPLAEGGRIVYDSGRNVLVSTTWANRVWEFDGATVVERALAQTPPSRNFSSLAYDSARGVTVLFGGCNDHFDTFHQDTWEYDGNYSETPPDHYELGFQPTWPDEDCQSDADLDADGLAGCADPDCEGRRCAGGVCTGGVCQ